MKRDLTHFAWAESALKYMWLAMHDNAVILLAIFLIIVSHLFTFTHKPDQGYRAVTVSHSDTCQAEAIDICKTPESLKTCKAPESNEQIISHHHGITGELFFCPDSNWLQHSAPKR